MKASDVRKGQVLILNGQPCRVMDYQHRTPGNLRAFVQVRMRNQVSQAMATHRFSSEDFVEKVSLDEQEMEYLYQEGDLYHFMNTENYEQITLGAAVLGDAVHYLIPDLVVHLEFY